MPHRISGRLRLPIALTLIASSIAAAGVLGGPSSPVAAAPVGAPAVSLIGDSTMLAMRSYSSTAGGDPRAVVGDVYALTFDAESCRRLVDPSCGRTTQPVSTLPLMKGALRGRLGEALVIMAGYDDASIGGDVDLIMAEAKAQGVLQVLWLNYPTSTPYVLPGGLPAKDLYQSHNAELIAAAGRHPSLSVLDWDEYSNDYPGWLTADGIHLTRAGAFGVANYIKTALDASASIGRCGAGKAQTGSYVAPSTPAPVTTGKFGFTPIEPVRVLDTRDPALGGENGMMGQDRTLLVDVGSVVPANAVSAVLTVTAVDSCAAGYLVVHACGGRPPTSNVNYVVGRNTAGVAIAPLVAGKFCVYAYTSTDVVIDVTGAFTPGGDSFHPLTPTRLVDTRSGPAVLTTVLGQRIAPAETEITVAGVAGVPGNATGAWLNVTVADPTANTVLGAYPGPCGASGGTSSVNARPSRSAASAVLVGIGPNGTVCVRTFAGRSHIVVDIAGWFGPGAGGLRLSPTEPARLLDTRANGATMSSVERRVNPGGVAVLNVAAVDSSVNGFVTVKPCGNAAVSSLLNTVPTEVVANLAVVAGDTSGQVCLDPSASSHLVVDQVARFVP